MGRRKIRSDLVFKNKGGKWLIEFEGKEYEFLDKGFGEILQMFNEVRTKIRVKLYPLAENK